MRPKSDLRKNDAASEPLFLTWIRLAHHLQRFVQDVQIVQSLRSVQNVLLDYMVTSNHVHLLVKDTGGDVIAQSMQLIAGRTAQEYNQRKNRHGAFWEDRYHASAIEADEHLHRCLVYIDLNMVRAGAVSHPTDWEQSGISRDPEASEALRYNRPTNFERVERVCRRERFSNCTSSMGRANAWVLPGAWLPTSGEICSFRI